MKAGKRSPHAQRLKSPHIAGVGIFHAKPPAKAGKRIDQIIMPDAKPVPPPLERGGESGPRMHQAPDL
jgi:hypothetical protein